jgi:hypothetical protein
MNLKPGAFVRVKLSHKDWWRAGLDGMVVEDFGWTVALFFGFDRYNVGQHTVCVGPELWTKSELDMTTVEN